MNEFKKNVKNKEKIILKIRIPENIFEHYQNHSRI